MMVACRALRHARLTGGNARHAHQHNDLLVRMRLQKLLCKKRRYESLAGARLQECDNLHVRATGAVHGKA